MIIYIDIDNTIFNTSNMEYGNSTPIINNIKKVNKWWFFISLGSFFRNFRTNQLFKKNLWV